MIVRKIVVKTEISTRTARAFKKLCRDTGSTKAHILRFLLQNYLLKKGYLTDESTQS